MTQPLREMFQQAGFAPQGAFRRYAEEIGGAMRSFQRVSAREHRCERVDGRQFAAAQGRPKITRGEVADVHGAAADQDAAGTASTAAATTSCTTAPTNARAPVGRAVRLGAEAGVATAVRVHAW